MKNNSRLTNLKGVCEKGVKSHPPADNLLDCENKRFWRGFWRNCYNLQRRNRKLNSGIKN